VTRQVNDERLGGRDQSRHLTLRPKGSPRRQTMETPPEVTSTRAPWASALSIMPSTLASSSDTIPRSTTDAPSDCRRMGVTCLSHVYSHTSLQGYEAGQAHISRALDMSRPHAQRTMLMHSAPLGHKALLCSACLLASMTPRGRATRHTHATHPCHTPIAIHPCDRHATSRGAAPYWRTEAGKSGRGPEQQQ